MNYIKVENVNNNGVYDYKGLEISKNVIGSQVYDFNNNLCILKTTSHIPSHDDISVLIEKEYESLKKTITDSQTGESENNLEKEVKELKQTVADLTEIVLMGGM